MQTVGCRSAGVNACAGDPELAARFLQFLTSEAYNRLIVADADALPPNPTIAETPEFLEPQSYPAEQGAHARYFRAAEEFGVGAEFSKFVNPETVWRIIRKHLGGIDSREVSIERGLQDITDEINLEIRRTVERDSRLAGGFEKAAALQEKIDQVKAAGREVPLEWIANPVLRHLREAGK
jgi:multiple sugar transport system substrate-binding protein